MLGKIEHIGIAVKNLEEAEKRYTQLLGIAPYKREEVASEMVITSFFMAGQNKIELLQATSPESAIAKFIDKRGEGIHHIAYEVADIRAEMVRLRELGFTLLNNEPKPGADRKLICFVHPRDAHGALVELCQSI
ncbi:MAG: methylmalonyl-CoA epimerase [Thermaurantimonas sp.]